MSCVGARRRSSAGGGASAAVAAMADLLQAEHPVPLLDESRVGGRKLLDVREEQIVIAELESSRHGRRILAQGWIVVEGIVLVDVLSPPRHEPVEEEPRRLRMRGLAEDTCGKGGRRQSIRWGHELDRRALLLGELVAGPPGHAADLVVTLPEPVEDLRPQVEAARALLGELLPEPVAIQTSQLVPLDELGPARRLLGAD